MSRPIALVVLTLLASSAIGSVEAQSLRVFPADTNSALVSLETDNKEGIAIQARIFRWSQADGEDKLEKTEDVVVSPPALRVGNGASSTVRLVRVAKTPVSGDETYRVFLEEIPERKKLQSGAIALAVRHSLPVFFAGYDRRPGSITWRAIERNRTLFLEATNVGEKRVKVTNLTVTAEGNREVVKINGFAGFVLGGQSKAWPLSGSSRGSVLTIQAESDTGPINATAIAGKSG
jgi:fimbrial chaperone protein